MLDRRRSEFVETDFAGSRFRGVDMTGVTISDAWLVDVDQLGESVGGEWSYHERMTIVRDHLAEVSSDELAREVPSPNGGTTTVGRCFRVVFDEEWWHDRYANRDLGVLEGGPAASTPPP